jgi:hypothetical protein
MGEPWPGATNDPCNGFREVSAFLGANEAPGRSRHHCGEGRRCRNDRYCHVHCGHVHRSHVTAAGAALARMASGVRSPGSEYGVMQIRIPDMAKVWEV